MKDASMFARNVTAMRDIVSNLNQAGKGRTKSHREEEKSLLQDARIVWRTLIERHRNFFRPLHSSGAADRVALLENCGRRVFDALASHESNDDLEHIKSAIGDTFLDLEKLVHEQGHTTAKSQFSKNSTRRVQQLFMVNFFPEIGDRIKDKVDRPGKDAFEICKSIPARPEFRFLVTAKFVNFRKPFFAFDVWTDRQTAIKYVAIVTTHQAPFDVFLGAAENLEPLAGKDMGFSAFALDRDNGAISMESTRLNDVVTKMAHVAARSNELCFLRFDSQGLVFEAEVGRDGECQVRVITELQDLNSLAIRFAAKTFSHRWITNMGQSCLSDLIEVCAGLARGEAK